ncbi:RimJ/RimL family protein N-acetyltransferase [Kroppenstedtia sanguinis]|uniref:GNAT family N-acetyltransferase n=1 Tax=Kroppenstedtia sanguinis TaxID=1380684 RepID=UPI003D24BEA3
MSFLHLTLTLDPLPPELNNRLSSPRTLPGVRFFRLVEVPDDEACRQRLYPLVREGVLDDPGHQGGFESYDEFCERIYSRSYRDHAATQFLAASEEEWVGLCSLTLKGDKTARAGLTVVKQSGRGQGIATELKRRSILACLNHGVRRVTTRVHETNVPMLTINRHLGFTEETG